MATTITSAQYRSGMYSPKRTHGEQLAENYFRELDKRLIQDTNMEKGKNKVYPSICFSRKIGVGALEIADILAQKIHYDVVDKEILEYIADKESLSQKTVAYFDERYPGQIEDFIKMLFAEKSFTRSNYSQHLFQSVVAIAGLSPTIFVGRGAHLVLPVEHTLAVRFVCSDEYRIDRIANIMNIPTSTAKSIIVKTDKDQKTFFSKVFGKKDATAYEFDMVINCDRITNPEDAADIVACAFGKKFPFNSYK